MEYKALYRRFRPQIFSDVIGQDPITRTLKNQIRASNISHAYLFCGTRGTGKTSTARIFARAINCLNPQDFDPCNKCEICQGILSESNIDIVEIDGASNRGVENIRELRETVKYPPSRGRYKVYIIDEVHMLTMEAFNALLKTLEEPPKHIVFILATTDPQKLPATILSRCQRFDFKAITTRDIEKRLGEICGKMGIEAEGEALKIIAVNAEGALRDALSVLEQTISFSDGKLTEKDVIDVLGIVNYEIIFNMVEAVAKKDSSQAISLVQKVVSQGKDIQQLIKDLIYYFRNLMMLNLNIDLEELLSISGEILKKLDLQSKKFNTETITQAIYVLSDLEAKAKYTGQPRILLEIALINLCQDGERESINELARRLDRLEEIIELPQAKEDTKGDLVTKKSMDEEDPLIIIGKRAQEDQSIKTKKSKGDRPETVGKPLEDKTQDFSIIRDKWQEIKDFIRNDRKASVEAILKEGKLETIKGNILIISFKDGFGFHRETLDREKNKEYIASVIEKITGQKISPSFVMEDELPDRKKESEEDLLVKKLKEIVPEEILKIVDE